MHNSLYCYFIYCCHVFAIEKINCNNENMKCVCPCVCECVLVPYMHLNAAAFECSAEIPGRKSYVAKEFFLLKTL